MEIFNFLLHLDLYIAQLSQFLGPWVYVVLFLIIFAETGLVVMPFLPGDSLLFIVGTLAGAGYLDIRILLPTLLVAAVVGDSVNYWTGHRAGPKIFSKPNSRLFNPAHLEKTRLFYLKHGGKTIVLARFLPIVRTFAPFVAGIGRMDYRTFLFYNLIGAILWVSGLTLAGYFFGGLPIVKDNFSLATLIIILVSLLPTALEYWRHRRKSSARRLG